MTTSKRGIPQALKGRNTQPYYALSGLTDLYRIYYPRAMPWAVELRPCGAFTLIDTLMAHAAEHVELRPCGAFTRALVDRP